MTKDQKGNGGNMKDLQKLLESETDAERKKRMAGIEKRIKEKIPDIKKGKLPKDWCRVFFKK